MKKTILTLIVCALSSSAFAEIGGLEAPGCSALQVDKAAQLLDITERLSDNGLASEMDVNEAKIIFLNLQVCSKQIAKDQFCKQKMNILVQIVKDTKTLVDNSMRLKSSLDVQEARLKVHQVLCR